MAARPRYAKSAIFHSAHGTAQYKLIDSAEQMISYLSVQLLGTTASSDVELFSK